MTDEEFGVYLQDQVCKAFNVKPWEIGIGKAPWYLRPAYLFRRLRHRLRRRHEVQL